MVIQLTDCYFLFSAFSDADERERIEQIESKKKKRRIQEGSRREKRAQANQKELLDRFTDGRTDGALPKVYASPSPSPALLSPSPPYPLLCSVCCTAKDLLKTVSIISLPTSIRHFLAELILACFAL